MSQEKAELLPCPFCGNDGLGPIEHALHISHTEPFEWNERHTWTVQCDKCTATMGYSDSEDEAIAAWNRRAPLSALVPDEVAGVVTELRVYGNAGYAEKHMLADRAAFTITALVARAEKAERELSGLAQVCVDGGHTLADAHISITTLEAENAALRARLEEAGRREPLAFLVHNMMPPKMPVQARGKFQEPDHFLYPATRENDARETAKIMRGDLTPLYAKEMS